MKIYTQIRWLSNFQELNLETITISSWIPLFCVPKSEISWSPNIFYTMYMYPSMTSLLTHTVAHSTRHFFRPKTNNQPLKKFLSLSVSWVKIVKNCKIVTFKVNFLCQKSSESFHFFFLFSLKNMKLGAQLSLMTLFV